MNSRKRIHSFLGSVLVFSLFCLGYIYFEPVIAFAVTDVVVVTQGVTSEITISAPADVTMSPAIAGMTGGTGDGSATWTVVTNDTSGFNLKLKASASPALVFGAYSFADYAEVTSGTPDYTWSVAAADSEFGYTVQAATTADLAAAFKDNGTACNTGTADAVDKCWDGFSTSDATVINRSSITSSSGEAEVVKFRAQSGASHFQAEGTYTATITATALTN